MFQVQRFTPIQRIKLRLDAGALEGVGTVKIAAHYISAIHSTHVHAAPMHVLLVTHQV